MTETSPAIAMLPPECHEVGNPKLKAGSYHLDIIKPGQHIASSSGQARVLGRGSYR